MFAFSTTDVSNTFGYFRLTSKFFRYLVRVYAQKLSSDIIGWGKILQYFCIAVVVFSFRKEVKARSVSLKPLMLGGSYNLLYTMFAVCLCVWFCI